MQHNRKNYQLHKDHKIGAQYGFVLPTILVLSVVLLTLGLSVFQLTSTIARSLTDQYWERVAAQTKQAGVAYMSNCIDQGYTISTWPVSITQSTNCQGVSITSPTSVNTNTLDTGPAPGKYKTNFTIYRPVTGADGIPKARVIGKAEVLNTTGTTIKTYTSEITVILNGFTGFLSQISTGKYYTCAISNGQVYCWGRNHVGQLGNGNNTDSKVPVAVNTSGVLSGKTVTQITTGHSHACAIADSQAYCWGRNNDGGLGNNSTTSSSVPVAVNTSGVLSGKTVTQITGGSFHTCAIADSQPYCWGLNLDGELGNGNNTNSRVPVAVNISGVLSGKTVTQIAAGASGEHTCVIADSQPYCWGSNKYGSLGNGQLGNGSTSDSNIPVAVDISGVLSGKTVTQIKSGQAHTCSIADGQAYCWGYNGGNGALGNSGPSSLIPTAVDTSGVLSGKTITQISTNDFHTCVITTGQAVCWGNNFAGQLGDGTTTNSYAPVAVSTSGVLNNRVLTQITAGVFHTCALASGQAYCWGYNNYSQLGDGTTTNRSVPIKSYSTF